MSRRRFLANLERTLAAARRRAWLSGWRCWVRFHARDEPARCEHWRAGFDAAADANERGGARPVCDDAADEFEHRVSP